MTDSTVGTGDKTGDQETNGGKPTGTDSQGKVDISTLPTAVQEYIRNLRQEAKEHREAKEALEGKVTELTEEVETAQAASRTMSENAEKAQRALIIRDLRDTYGLDKNAEKFLTAQSEEELKEQAEALSAFAAPQKKTDDGPDGAGGGQNSGGMSRVTDPAQTAEEKVDPDQARVEAFFGGLS